MCLVTFYHILRALVNFNKVQVLYRKPNNVCCLHLDFTYLEYARAMLKECASFGKLFSCMLTTTLGGLVDSLMNNLSKNFIYQLVCLEYIVHMVLVFL